ncbi:Pkinase-domain-containing protein [Stereum hirsutum FP-91666 SS1]|uniref:Pkinase-domain-containing protein n=1 Tax=Stereum hirsutum (strain FP-91666) TaxID=721885 RepID=UPI000444A4D8|nr:Pkinase-domain-containing protein [Stereum hirsutum FP-91666 SS1]EIM83718.1 Pkinase-domain-containing protein [Stereum hirsutum FP-91666 SS1]
MSVSCEQRRSLLVRPSTPPSSLNMKLTLVSALLALAITATASPIVGSTNGVLKREPLKDKRAIGASVYYMSEEEEAKRSEEEKRAIGASVYYMSEEDEAKRSEDEKRAIGVSVYYMSEEEEAKRAEAEKRAIGASVYYMSEEEDAKRAEADKRAIGAIVYYMSEEEEAKRSEEDKRAIGASVYYMSAEEEASARVPFHSHKSLPKVSDMHSARSGSGSLCPELSHWYVASQIMPFKYSEHEESQHSLPFASLPMKFTFVYALLALSSTTIASASLSSTNDPLKLEDVSRDGPFCLSPDALAAILKFMEEETEEEKRTIAGALSRPWKSVSSMMVPVTTMPPGHKQSGSVAQNYKAQLVSAYNELGKELSSTKIKVVGNYTLGKVIGEGAYGKVRLGTHRLTSTRVAIKQIPKGLSATLTREIHHHRQLHHPHVTQLYEIIATESSIWLVTELCSGGELFDYLAEKGRLTEDEARIIFGQLCLAVNYIHDKGIVHRDLKLENVLLDERCRVKLGDFGFTREFDKGAYMETFCGTTGYASPEMLEGKKYLGPEVDVWSLGVILYCLLTGTLPFDDDDEGIMRNKVIIGEFEDPEWLSEEFRDLIKNILQKDPSKRLTIPQILAHSWFTNHVPSSRVVSPIPFVHSPPNSTSATSPGETAESTTNTAPIHDASGSSVTSESTLYNTSSEFEASSATSPDDEEDEHEALHLHRNPSQSTIKKWEGGNGGRKAAAASVSKKQQPETVEEEEMTPQPAHQSWAYRDNGSHSRPPSRPRSPAINTSNVNMREPPLPTRTPVRTKRRSVSSQLSDHEDSGSPERRDPSPTPAEKFAIPLPPQDFASLLRTPAPIIFGTQLERDLLNGLSGLGFDTAQIVHSVLSDACDATGAMWWILKRRAEKKVLEEGGLSALAQVEKEKERKGHGQRSSRKDEAGRRGSVSDRRGSVSDKLKKRSDHGHGRGGRGGEDDEGDDTPMAPTRVPGTMAVHSAPELAFIPPTPTGPSHQQPSTPPRPRSPNNPFLTPTMPSAATNTAADSLSKSHQSYPSTPAGSVKDKDTKENKEGSKGRREGKARSGSVSIMQRATTALEAAGLVRKRSSEMVKEKDKDEKGKGKEDDKRPSTTTADESRSSHGSAAGRAMTKSPPLRPVKDTTAIPSTPGMDYGDPMTSSPAVTGSPWVIAGGGGPHGGMSSPDPDLFPTPANSPGDTLTALPNISESGIKSSGHHRNRASLLSAFRMWFNEDRKGKRKAGAGSASGMAYGHGPRTPSSGEHRGTVKPKRRPSQGSARNGHRAKGPSISSHRSSSVNSRRSSTASMHMVVLDSPQYGIDHMVNISRQRSDPSRRSFGSHTPNSERGEYPSSRPSSVQSFSYKHRHRKSPSASSAGSVQHLGRASPYHRRGGSGSSTRVVRSPAQNLNRPAHARTNSATSSIHSLPSSRPGSFYEQSEGESAMRTASPFRAHNKRSYDETTPRRNPHAHSHGNSTFVAQKRQTPFMPPAVSYSSSGGSVGRTSWKKSWGLEPPGWQSRTASLPIEVLAISPAGEGSSGIRDVFTGRTSLSNPSGSGGGSGRPGSGGAGGMRDGLDDESDWVDEDDDVPAFAGGLGQVSSLASGLPVSGLGGGGASPLPLDQTFGGYPVMEAPVILSPVPARGASAASRSASGKRAGKGTNGGVGGGSVAGGGSAGPSGSRKAGHSPIGRISPLPIGSEDSLRHEAPEARGGRRGQLPNNRSGAAFRTIVIQEEDEGEEE